MARTRGAPPANLTGGRRIRSLDSPWWDRVTTEIGLHPDLVGRTLTIEEITQLVPSYPDGRRPRPMAVARRMRCILELASRGPNGSRSRGARYRILAIPTPTPVAREDVEDIVIRSDRKWLLEQIERMTKGK
jgi:hypothetical protein